MFKFKVGDRVRKKSGNPWAETNSPITVVTKVAPGFVYGERGTWVTEGELELVTEMQYEDKWHLNDGSSPIPEDAETLEHNGSVVAYRKPVREIQVGDVVEEVSSGIYMDVVSKFTVSEVYKDVEYIVGQHGMINEHYFKVIPTSKVRLAQ